MPVVFERVFISSAIAADFADKLYAAVAAAVIAPVYAVRDFTPASIPAVSNFAAIFAVAEAALHS